MVGHLIMSTNAHLISLEIQAPKAIGTSQKLLRGLEITFNCRLAFICKNFTICKRIEILLKGNSIPTIEGIFQFHGLNDNNKAFPNTITRLP